MSWLSIYWLLIVTQWHRHILPLELPWVHHDLGAGIPQQGCQGVRCEQVQDWPEEDADWHKHHIHKFRFIHNHPILLLCCSSSVFHIISVISCPVSIVVVTRFILCSCLVSQPANLGQPYVWFANSCQRPHLSQNINVWHHVKANQQQRRYNGCGKEELAKGRVPTKMGKVWSFTKPGRLRGGRSRGKPRTKNKLFFWKFFSSLSLLEPSKYVL